MALEYFLYNESYNNTLVDRSMTTFAPTPVGFDQILIDFLIPETQPLYLYKEDSGFIVLNDDDTINAYLSGTAPPPQPEDAIETQTFTGYTATTQQEFTGYTEVTAPATYVNVSGDTMTGTLCSTSNLLASGTVTGSSVAASVLITTPVLNASTSVSAPQITGTTCITTPISCATTRMQAPVVCGGICSVSPIINAGSCLCSVGTTALDGATVIGSSLSTVGAINGGSTVSGTSMYASASFLSPTISAIELLESQTCLCSVGTSYFDGGITGSTVDLSGNLITSGSLFATQSISGTSFYSSVDVLSPKISAIELLEAQTETKLLGAVTGASTLNVSGVTRFGSALYIDSTPPPPNNEAPTLFWNPTTKQIEAKQTSGGSIYYEYSERITLEITAGGVPVKYLGFTGATFPAGTYQVDFTEQVGQSNANQTVFGRFEIDGVLQGSEFLLKMNVSNFTFSNTLSRDYPLTGGTHCFDMYFWNNGGVACATFGSIRVRQV